VPNPCARPNQQQFTSRLDRKSTCVDADNNRFGRRGNGASRISALFPAAAAKILSPPVVFFAEVEKHATRSLAQMQRKAIFPTVGARIFHATIVPAFEMSSDCFKKSFRPIRRVFQTPNEIISFLILGHKSLPYQRKLRRYLHSR
jgi:hypothetical protein